MSNVAGNADDGENSGSDDDDERNREIAGGFNANIPSYTTEERFATWTESLGFESFNESVACGDITEKEEYQSSTPEVAEGTGTGTRSRSRSRKRKRESNWLDTSKFPPLLSTLNVNGRTRFDFIKSRDNGRLQMTMVQSESLQLAVLQTTPMREEKRLKMMLIGNDYDAQDQHHDHDDMDDDEDQNQQEEERSQSNVGDAPDHEV